MKILKGDIVTPTEVLIGGWVAVSGQEIHAIGAAGTTPPEGEVFDYGDALVLPGVIDGQTHATSARGLAGFASTTRSALAGGVTTIVDMPYDNPLPLDRPERLDTKKAAIAEAAYCDVALYGTITAETGTAHVADLIDGGVCAFKVSSFESSPTRFPRIGANLVLDLFEALAPTGLPLGLHNEDQEIVNSRMARAKASGEEGIGAHGRSRPLAAELAATAQFAALAEASGAHAHPVHLSCREGVDLLASFAARGVKASAETCVHYLWIDEDRDGARLGARMKVSPPIRSGAIEPLWQAIEEGLVAFTSSDHSSWPVEGKLTASIFDAGAGIPGLETLLPAFYTVAAARSDQATLLTAAQLATRPAKFFGLDRKGSIEPGKDADFAILARRSQVWDEARAHDELCWSPFHGETFAGTVVSTWLRGREVYAEGQDNFAAASGEFVARGKTAWFAQGENN